MPEFSARRAALTALNRWRIEHRFADSIVAELPFPEDSKPADRAFSVELFYGVLRNLTLLDFWIARLRSGHLSAQLRDILRLGFYQLFLLETAEHAAVFETVELALKKERVLINGILRAALRRKTELLSEGQAQPLPVRASHPKFLVARWRKSFGDENTEILCRWNNRPPELYARINGLKIDRKTFLQKYCATRAVPGHPEFVEFHPLSRKAIEHGECYVQDPSTVIACKLMDPKPGEKILDACAAPGGKTACLAELMENRGTVVACDRDRARVRMLQENLARLGVKVCRTICHDWEKDPLAEDIESVAPFDRILVDAPCSNTGVMRRRVDVRWRLRPDEFARMQKRQLAILRSASALLRPGGTLVYSTCSLEPEENEDVIQKIVGVTPTLRPEKQQWSRPFENNFDGAFAAKLSDPREIDE